VWSASESKTWTSMAENLCADLMCLRYEHHSKVSISPTRDTTVRTNRGGGGLVECL